MRKKISNKQKATNVENLTCTPVADKYMLKALRKE